MDMINLSAYPINIEADNPKGSHEYEALVQECIAQMHRQGFVSLPNFLHYDAVNVLIASISALEKQAVGFYSSESHNVFLENNIDPPDKDCKHPRHIRLCSSKTIINAHDLSPRTPELSALFFSTPFLNFISSVLHTKLYPSTDPYGMFYANIFREEDGLNWHFDRSEYSVSLILQPAQSGGKFQFVPDSRDAVGDLDEMPLEVDELERALLGSASSPRSMAVHEPDLNAGDLYLFRGKQSLHRVSGITKGERINVILTYNTEPGIRLNNYTLQKFFGVEGESC
jgi:hypothetical protein